MVFKERSVDWPPEIVKRWGGKFVELPNGMRGVRWPVVNVDKVGAIPADCPCPMGVPITVFDKMSFGPDSDFELVSSVGDATIGGREIYQRVIIRNRAYRKRILGV